MKGKKTGGHVKGTPNKATSELRLLAQEHTEAAIEALVSVMQSSRSDQARVMAIRELFDRGYGKAAQAIQHSGMIAATHEELLKQHDNMDDADREDDTAPAA